MCGFGAADSMMGIRSRNRSRQGALCPAISSISVVCFGALLLLAVLSVLSGRLLDIDSDSRNRSEPSRGSAQIFQFEDEDSPVRSLLCCEVGRISPIL